MLAAIAKPATGLFSLAQREALFAVAQAACGNKPGRVAIATLAGLFSQVEGEGALAERLALLAKPSTQSLAVTRGWLAKQVEAGKLTQAQFYAAQEIGRAVAEGLFSAASGLRAVDPTRLVVDGGKFSLGSLGGTEVKSSERRKYERWVAFIRAMPERQAVVRGAGDDAPAGLYRDALVVRVVVDGAAPSTLDREYRLQNGRTKDVVLVELARFAKGDFAS